MSVTEEEAAVQSDLVRERQGSPVVETGDGYKELCQDMFEKLTDYLNGELAVTVEEYQLLLKLNQMTTMKYEEMTNFASRLQQSSQTLNEKFTSMQPYCDHIDQIEASVTALEQTAYRLDAYCKRLEAKFRELEKH